MESGSRLLSHLGPAALLLKAILLSLTGILTLIGFIALRRWRRGRYFERLKNRTYIIRAHWDEIISGQISTKVWRLKPIDCLIVEEILLDSIETASAEQLPALLFRLRESGLLDTRIFQARKLRGWKQRSALVALGRTRAPEAVPALVEALDAPSQDTRVAAVRGLGRTGLVEAGVALLDHYVAGQLHVPEHVLKNALVTCCRANPSLLLSYMSQSRGATRELLARMLGELAGPDLMDELLVLTADPLPEVRASAARALGNARSSVALAALAALSTDSVWFVRLRAMVALGSLEHPGRIKPLLRGLCDVNRHVRQRAAWALAREESDVSAILEQVIASRDKYALQAFVSELERSGAMDKVIQTVFEHAEDASGKFLLDALTNSKKVLQKHAQANAATAGDR